MISEKPKVYRINAPAKINTGLRVLSKRKDGFHNIETIFYPIALFDVIKISIEKLPDTRAASRIIIKTNSELNIENEKNICYRAVKMFMDRFEINGFYKFSVHIKKNIPTGAGLGGGSSDAASVLKVLAKHFRLPVTDSAGSLHKLAAELGSDVPFFLKAKPAYAEGKGERLTLLPRFKIKSKILVVNPGIHISTPNAYKQLKVKRSKVRLLNQVKAFSFNNEKLLINDFERAVFKEHPEIENIKYDLLKLGAGFALMSGSGSSVYGLFGRREIVQAKKHFKKMGYRVFEA